MAAQKSTNKSELEISAMLGSGIADQHNQYLTFTVNKERFAVSILKIKEIIEYRQLALTPVPMMPDHVRGVINLRGRVVPVIDLSAKFNMGVRSNGKRTCIVIIEVEFMDQKMDIGIIVDAVESVVEISPNEIEPAPSFGSRIRTDFIEGMGRSNDSFIIIINSNNVLSAEELSGFTEE